MSERIICALKTMQSNFDVVIINSGQSSFNTDYEATHNYKKYVLDNFDKKFIFNTPTMAKNAYARGAAVQKQIMTEFKQHFDKNTKAVIFDDSRSSQVYSQIYNMCKQQNCTVFANSHGNSPYNKIDLLYGFKGSKFYDYILVFGQFDIDNIRKLGHNENICLPVGIPSNDALKSVPLGNKHILVVSNMVLPGQWGVTKKLDCSSTARHMCKKTLENMDLINIQKGLGKEVIFKLKHRINSPKEEEVDYLKNAIPKGLDYKIVYNDNENKLISNSCCVISYGSTMMFKPIQQGIPTVIYKELGDAGNFTEYKGLISLNDDYSKLLTKDFIEKNKTEFLDYTLTGGLKFNETKSLVTAIFEKIC